MGWETEFLQQAVDTCTNDSGRIEDCAIFDVVDEATAKSCEFNVPPALSGEKVFEALNLLPGDVEITYGEGSDEPVEEKPKPKPTLSYTPGSIPTDINSPLPGQVFKETSAYVAPVPTTTSAPVVSVAAVPAVEPQPAPTSVHALEYVEIEPNYKSTQLVTNGNLVSKIYWAEETVWVTEVLGSTVTVEGRAAPSADAEIDPVVKRHAHRHLHPHGRRHL